MCEEEMNPKLTADVADTCLVLGTVYPFIDWLLPKTEPLFYSQNIPVKQKKYSNISKHYLLNFQS